MTDDDAGLETTTTTIVHKMGADANQAANHAEPTLKKQAEGGKTGAPTMLYVFILAQVAQYQNSETQHKPHDKTANQNNNPITKQ